MKITLQTIRRRQQELERIISASKKNQEMTEEIRDLIAHHEKLLENDTNYVEPFLQDQPEDLQDFIRHYYFDAKSETTFNLKFYPDSDKDNASRLRKAVERAAEKWCGDIEG